MESLDSIALVTLVCSWTFTFLVILVLGLQLYGKRCILHREIDGIDYLTILTLLCSLVLVCQTIWAVVDQGQGRHVENEAPSQFEIVAKSLLANEVVWTFVSMLVRCTALWFLLRLFGIEHTWYNRSLYIMLTLTILHGIASILTACFICRPVAFDWNSSIDGTCGNQTVAFISIEAIGLVLDIEIVLFPVIGLYRVKIEIIKKVGIFILLGIGGLNIVFTGLRFASLQRVTSNDFTYDRSFLELYSCLGALSGVFLGNIVGLVPLFRKSGDRNETQTINHDMPHKHIGSKPSEAQHAGEETADERTKGLVEELTRQHTEEVTEVLPEKAIAQLEAEPKDDPKQELTEHNISIPSQKAEMQAKGIPNSGEIV